MDTNMTLTVDITEKSNISKCTKHQLFSVSLSVNFYFILSELFYGTPEGIGNEVTKVELNWRIYPVNGFQLVQLVVIYLKASWEL